MQAFSTITRSYNPLVRNDMNLNENERVSNFTLIHNVMWRSSTFIAISWYLAMTITHAWNYSKTASTLQLRDTIYLCLIVDDRFLAPPKQVIQCGTVSYVVVKQTLVDMGISKVPSSIGLCFVSIKIWRLI
jgi:hypothetical protein